MSKKKSGRRVWRGVTTATASLLALSVCASTVVDGFRTDIDKFLGTKSTKLVTEDSDGTDLYTFKSDYTSTTELLHGIQDVGERMSEEGSVLLKNNGALPLTKDETQKITLLGFSSYYPVQAKISPKPLYATYWKKAIKKPPPKNKKLATNISFTNNFILMSSFFIRSSTNFIEASVATDVTVSTFIIDFVVLAPTVPIPLVMPLTTVVTVPSEAPCSVNAAAVVVMFLDIVPPQVNRSILV